MSPLLLWNPPPDDRDPALPFVWLVLVAFVVIILGQMFRDAPAATPIDEPVPAEWERPR